MLGPVGTWGLLENGGFLKFGEIGPQKGSKNGGFGKLAGFPLKF